MWTIATLLTNQSKGRKEDVKFISKFTEWHLIKQFARHSYGDCYNSLYSRGNKRNGGLLLASGDLYCQMCPFIAEKTAESRWLIVGRHVGSPPGLSRRHEYVVSVQHVLSQLAVLGISSGAQGAREVLLAAALESQVFHQVVPHLIQSAALVTAEGPIALDIAPESARSDRWQLCKKGMIR